MRRAAFLPAIALLGLAAAAPVQADDPAATGLRAEYFDTKDLSGPAVVRVDRTVDFDWGSGSPVAGIAPDTFSARWTGTIRPRYSERYTISTRSDDGVRVWVDGHKVIDDFTDHGVTTDAGTADLQAGRTYDVKVEYYENTGLAEMHLRWKSASQALEAIPADRLVPPAAAPAPTPPVPTPAPAPATPDSASTDPSPLPATPAPVATATQPVTTTPAVATTQTDDPAADSPAADTPLTPPVAAPPVDALASDVLAPPSPPVAGEHFNAAPEPGGQVQVRLTGSRTIIGLDRGATLPVGTHVDTTYGGVRIDTAPARNVTPVARHGQWAIMTGAMFTVAQPGNGDKVVAIDLEHGDFDACPGGGSSRSARATGAHAAAAKPAKRVVRKLWAHGKGRFRTRGRSAAAAVRGTHWSVEDRCDATVVAVTEGVVDATNAVTQHVETLRAGQSYTVARDGTGRRGRVAVG